MARSRDEGYGGKPRSKLSQNFPRWLWGTIGQAQTTFRLTQNTFKKLLQNFYKII